MKEKRTETSSNGTNSIRIHSNGMYSTEDVLNEEERQQSSLVGQATANIAGFMTRVLTRLREHEYRIERLEERSRIYDKSNDSISSEEIK